MSLFSDFVASVVLSYKTESGDQYESFAMCPSQKGTNTVPVEKENEKALFRIQLKGQWSNKSAFWCSTYASAVFCDIIQFRHVSKLTQSEEFPSSMLVCSQKVQRRLKVLGFNINLFQRNICRSQKRPRIGSGDRFAGQQAQRLVRKFHNLPTRADVCSILSSEFGNDANAKRLCNLLILVIGLEPRIRTTEL